MCAVKDACSNWNVGLSMGPRMTSDLACNALRYAISARLPMGTLVNSGRSGHFPSRAFATTLRAAGLQGSTRRVVSAAENATMEPFFALLQKNVPNRRRWDTRAELRLAILTWIECDYHRRRRHAALGRLDPIEFETIHNAATAA